MHWLPCRISVLHEAIEVEDAEEVHRLLVDAPELAQQQDRSGRTPLHLAVIRGDTESTTVLLAAGAQVDAVDHVGFRPIHYAYWGSAYWSERENPEKLANPLYKAGARDSATLASARGDLDAVRTFVEADRATVNDPDTLQKRPLSAAVERGHRKIARYLLDEGADPTLRETRLCPNGFCVNGGGSSGRPGDGRLAPGGRSQRQRFHRLVGLAGGPSPDRRYARPALCPWWQTEAGLGVPATRRSGDGGSDSPLL